MQWTKPDFQEITLNMEVTAYVNTDDAVVKPAEARRGVGPIAVPAPSNPPLAQHSESRG